MQHVTTRAGSAARALWNFDLFLPVCHFCPQHVAIYEAVNRSIPPKTRTQSHTGGHAYTGRLL